MTTPLNSLRLPMYATTTGRRHVVKWDPCNRFPGEGEWIAFCGLGRDRSRCGFNGTTTIETIGCEKCASEVIRIAALDTVSAAPQDYFDRCLKPRR